VTLSRDSRKSR